MREKNYFLAAILLACMHLFCSPLSASNSSKDDGGKKKNSPKISGYAQTGYVWKEDNGASISTFKVNRIRLIMTGNINPIFDYKMQIEGFSNSLDANRKSLLSIQDMFVRAKVNDALHIWVGQFPIPLSMENYDISPGTLEVVNFSSIVLNMVCRNAVNGFTHYGRDCGIMATGDLLKKEDYSVINYNLCLYNGYQLNQVDNNKAKDVVGRVTFRPFKELRLSGSFNWGEYDYVTNVSGVRTVEAENVSMSRFVLGGWYQGKNLMIRSEYGTQKSDKANVKEQMYYVIAGYKFANKYMPIFRYDVMENKNVVDSKKSNYLIGLLYTPFPKLRVQLNYNMTDYELSSMKQAKTFEAMLTYFF